MIPVKLIRLTTADYRKRQNHKKFVMNDLIGLYTALPVSKVLNKYGPPLNGTRNSVKN